MKYWVRESKKVTLQPLPKDYHGVHGVSRRKKKTVRSSLRETPCTPWLKILLIEWPECLPKKINLGLLTFIFIFQFSACLPTTVLTGSPKNVDPVPGRDKQLVGSVYGALSGAGSGAVTGAQLAGATGPGALVGAGFGALSGMFQGLGLDIVEEEQLRRRAEENRLRDLAWGQDLLAEHYSRRMRLCPNRDVFPADLFFKSDESALSREGMLLARELARLNKDRLPWSRFVIAAYASSREKDSSYALSLTGRRAREIALQFVQAGVEPRRLVTQSFITEGPLIIDPDDQPSRYAQAIEIIALD